MEDLHFENQLWRTRLAFYEDELKIYSARLSEVSAKNTAVDIKIKVEQFQNKFYINSTELALILKQIRSEESVLADKAKNNPTASDHMLFADHDEMRTKVEKFEEIYSELKQEFISFLHDSL
jgi:hypothetical protein